MTSHEIEKLIYDTLYYRRLDPNRQCLQVNLARLELERQSAEVLPQIEYVLRTVVATAPPPARRRIVFASGDEDWFEEDPFPGLSDLLGAYMRIGSKHDVARVVGFLRTLPPTLQAKAVALIPVFFRKAKIHPQEKDVNNLKEPPHEQLLSFVQEALQSEDQNLRESAVWTMSFYSP